MGRRQSHVSLNLSGMPFKVTYNVKGLTPADKFNDLSNLMQSGWRQANVADAQLH
jgi:hypothetical protein